MEMMEGKKKKTTDSQRDIHGYKSGKEWQAVFPGKEQAKEGGNISWIN